jgi:hypothetical protein
MAVGLPLKTTYANGDVYSASDVNDTNGTINTTAAPYAAGKNKIINGDFYINQRNFSSTTTHASFGFDRWDISYSGGTLTYSAQTFTAGDAPVAGYEGKNYSRLAIAGQTTSSQYAIYEQKIEDVRTLAGQTATISFWAKASSGTPKIAVELAQNFGTGGSPSSQVFTYFGSPTLTTSWVRYSVTAAIPSISGKTLGTNPDSRLTLDLWVSGGSDYNSRTGSLGLQTATIDIWGVQVENGSTATAFQTATGTIQGELAACQRYYWREGGNSAYQSFANGSASSTTGVPFIVNVPVSMRVPPTSVDYSTLAAYDNQTVLSISAVSINGGSVKTGSTKIWVDTTVTGAAQYRPYFLITNNSTSGYIGLSAEL